MTEEEKKTIEQMFEAMGNSGGRFVIGQVVGSQTINFNGKTLEYTNGSNRESIVPTTDRMKQAVEAVFKQGYCWSARAWAVVFRVYQIKGYNGSIKEFVREVEEWNIRTEHKCDYHAIQKPVSSGIYCGNPDRWKEQGAQGQAVKLAEALIEELKKES